MTFKKIRQSQFEVQRIRIFTQQIQYAKNVASIGENLVDLRGRRLIKSPGGIDRAAHQERDAISR
jgi:hypothetical protein